ncbi:D-galactonate dehydratase [Colletotrichum higginsianum]|uniref:D-galactonate dehydratase n=1 Tax=Colletotrichum higginsianum TaxID=80884 RepID=A0A4T0W976_9PEZI|nr:D-galactonate dehydratase [Colletotrichum higginsianum]
MAVQQNPGEECTVLHMLGRKELMYKLKYSPVYFPVVGYGPCPGIASQAFVSTLLAHFGIPNTDGPKQKHWILPRASPRWLFVKITDEEGNYGWGEAILEDHIQAVEGCLKFHKSQFTAGMDADAVFMSALSGVDCAMRPQGPTSLAWGVISEMRRIAAMCEAYDVSTATSVPGRHSMPNFYVREMILGIHYNALLGGEDLTTYIRNPNGGAPSTAASTSGGVLNCEIWVTPSFNGPSGEIRER